MKELRSYGFLSLEPRVTELPETVQWWRLLNLDEKLVSLVSDPGRYYLEISSDQIERLIPAAEKINGIDAAALVLNGRFSYEKLDFVFRPNPPVEPVYVICDNCGQPILAYHTTAEALESSSSSGNLVDCKHCGKLKKWSKSELWPLKVLRENFSDEIINKS